MGGGVAYGTFEYNAALHTPNFKLLKTGGQI